MTISYRTRQRIKRLLSTVMILAVAAVIVWLCWLLWLDRFIIYDRDYGAKLDFSLSASLPEGTTPTERPTRKPITIIYQDGSGSDPSQPGVDAGISGYYIGLDSLKSDMDGVMEQLRQLPAGTAVLLDVKNALGLFHYSTSVGDKISGDVDTAQFDALLEYLTASDLHVIARLPAFRDRYFGLNNIPSGLSFEGGGGALWVDKGGCFWLNPTKDKPLSYLISITKELRNLGFDEVVFTDFCFPDANNLVFTGDKAQAITDAAATLVEACAAEDFWISFAGQDASFPLPQGNCRLYLENVAAADVKTLAEQVATDNPAVHLLFYATSNDTRYDDYCVLRPLESAH